jgi:ribonuclease BN (tRNA processing enzyme)
MTSKIELEHKLESIDPFDASSFGEPQIFFLGTVSMKPSQYRGASAIYVFHNGHGILMDCAEGSYMQIYDHFGSKSKVDQVLLQTKVAFITHIHGDHQLGILKIMYERDLLLEKFDPLNKLYVVTPTPMMSWMELFVSDSLRFPEMVVLVPSKNLNPENQYYY